MANIDKKKFIKRTILILIIVFIIFILVYFEQMEKKSNFSNLSFNEISTNEDGITYMKSKYIKEEKSNLSPFYTDIYLTFGKLLFTGEESNETYYAHIIELVAKTNNYKSFRLIDTKNDIVVAVVCNYNREEIEQIIINNDPAYYTRIQSKKELKNYTKTQITEFNIESQLINNLIRNNWKINNLNFDLKNNYELGNGYKYYLNENIEMKIVKDKVFNIVFGVEHKEVIVNGLTATSTLEAVIMKLGKPTFGSIEEKYIGYKGKEIYLFFTEGQVSIYRVDENKEINLEKEINEYIQEKDLKRFVSNITDTWVDYDRYYYEKNSVDLTYNLKGVRVQYSITERHGITFYNNYVGAVINGKTLEELSKDENVDIPNFIYFINEDSVNEYEKSRSELYLLSIYGEEEDLEQ